MAALLPLPVSHTPKRALDQQFALVDESSGVPSSVETGVNHARTLYNLAKSELSFATTREAMLRESSSDWASLDVPIPQTESSTATTTATGTAGGTVTVTVPTPLVSWRDIPPLQRRYLLLQRINSSNVLEMLHEIDPSLAALNVLTRETWRPSVTSSSASPSSTAAYYARELDTLDKGRWKQKQLQWIAWTFVGYERRHPERYLGKLLVVDTIVACLVQRYHRYQRNIARTSASLHHLSLTTGTPSSGSSGHATNTNSGSDTKRNALLKSKHVSSLQRFQEICDWSWPLCLTVSIQKSFVWNKGGGETTTGAKPAFVAAATPHRNTAPSSSSPWHADPRAAVQEEWQIEVTDGWWWVRAVFDAPLRQLIREVPTAYNSSTSTRYDGMWRWLTCCPRCCCCCV
jgi:hypothetical protein